MKTEQEQIEQIEKVLKDSTVSFRQFKEKGACYCYAETLVAYGYGDVTEYKAEIERLRAENTTLYEVRNNLLEENDKLLKDNVALILDKRQAEIDVLNKMKKKYGFYSCYSWNCDVKSLNTIIDELIKESENGQ